MYVDFFTLIVLVLIAVSFTMSVVALIAVLIKKKRAKCAWAEEVKKQYNYFVQPPLQNVLQPYENALPPRSVHSSNKSDTVLLFEDAGGGFALSGSGNEYMHQLQLQEIRPDASKNHNVYISKGEDIIVGRSKEANLQVIHNTVARKQCSLAISVQGELLIQNLSNSNKTKLNGMILDKPHPINSGDNVSFGQVKLKLLDIRRYTSR